MGKYQGSSKLALKPSSTDEVSQLLAYCSLRRLAVVPQSGNTGLVGGSVPVFDEIVMNLSNLNKIISFDEVSWLIDCTQFSQLCLMDPGSLIHSIYRVASSLV